MLSSYSNNGFSPSTKVLTSTILKLLINPSLQSEYPVSKPGSPIPCVARLSNILCNFNHSVGCWKKSFHGQNLCLCIFSCIVIIYVLRKLYGSQFLRLTFVTIYILCFIVFFIHSRIKLSGELIIIRHKLITCLYHHKIYNFLRSQISLWVQW